MSQLSPSQRPLRVRACNTLKWDPVTWFWLKWLGLGKLVILDGDPGLGKSLITLDLCARFSTGRPMPDGSPGTDPSNVLVLSAEDNEEDTVNFRLKALGADQARVFVVDRDEIDWAEPVRLPSQIAALEQVVARYQAKLVVIDPFVAFLEPSISINQDQGVRQALYPLLKMAMRLGCTVILVRHFNKQNDWRARYRGGGSIGLGGICRCVWMVEHDPDQPDQCVLAQVKNTSAALQRSLAYRITSGPSTGDGLPSESVSLTWTGPSPWNADQLCAAATGKRPVLRELDKACQFLQDFLYDGPKTTREIWQAAEAQGLSERTLQRAKSKLKLSTSRRGCGQAHQSCWGLENQQPGDGAPSDEDPDDLSPWLKPLIEAYPPPTPLDEV